MNAAKHHPAHDQLARFGHGLLPPEEHQAVEEHVSTCNECTARLTALDADSLALLLRNGPSLTTGPDSTPMPPSLNGPTAPLPGLSLREGPLEHGDPGAIPEPLRDHPRYRVLRLLGQGGMGNVYLAEHRHMGRPVALKVINPGILDNPAAVRRFRQEVQAAARLSHPNIVQAHDADEAGGLHFLVLEYVEGQQLAAYAAAGPLPYPEACEYARQAALALQYAHEAGLVHRDVKPHNLMVTPDGRIKVLDFGLARLVARTEAVGSVSTQAGALMGTPDYMPPEQARDAATADGRADVYSLGCTLYHLLTGRPPFPGGAAVEKVARHLTEDVPALDAAALGLPAGLAEVVARMTARDPGQRYQTAREAAAGLAPFASPEARPRETIPVTTPVVATAVERGAVPRPDATVLAPTPRGPRGPARVPWGWVAVAAAALFVGFVALAAGVVVYRIQTDKGEIVIKTTDDDVEVVVKQGGKLVTIYDPKSKQKLMLHSGTYSLELKGNPTGLKLDLDKVTLRRGDRPIATIERTRKKDQPEIRQVRRFTGHTGWVCRVAFSSDGRRALSCGKDGSLRLWDVETGKQLRVFTGHTGQVHNVVFSADDRRALSAGWDYTVRLWDVDSGKEVRVFKGHGHVVFRAVFSPDGRQVFSTSQDGTLRVWDVESGRELRRFQAPVAQVGLAVSPDGRRVLGGGHPDAILRLWEVDGGKEPRRFEGHKERIPCVVFLPDGRRALSGSFDGALRLWDLESGDCLRRFPLSGRIGEVEDVAVTPDGRRAISASADGMVRLWDLESGRQLASFDGHKLEGGHPGDPGVVGCVISPDGRLALSAGGDKTVRLLRLPDPPAPKGEDKREVQADPPIIHPLHRIRWLEGGNSSILHKVDLSRDNRHVVATKLYLHAPRGQRIGEVARMWHLETGKFFREWSGAEAAWFTPDSKHVLSFARDAAFTLREVATGKVVRRFGTPITGRWVGDGTLSGRGNRVFRWTQRGEVQVFDWATGTELCQIDLGGYQGGNIQLTPDGCHIVYDRAGRPWRLRVYDAGTGKEVNAYPQLQDILPLEILQISRNGKSLLCRDVRNLKVHEVATGKEIGSFDGGVVPNGLLSGDGRRLLTTTDHRLELHVWDVPARRVIARLRFPESLNDLKGAQWQFSADGQWAAFAGPTDSVYVFRVPLDEKAKDR